MIGGLGATELIVILLIIVIIFGAKKLPEIGSGMGKAIKNFKGAISDSDEKKTDEDPGSDDRAENKEDDSKDS